MALDPRAMDQAVTYQDMEPMIESIVYDPLPEGLIDPDWQTLPEMEPQWFDLPEIEPEWLELSAIDQDWLQAIDQDSQLTLSNPPTPDHNLEMEH